MLEQYIQNQYKRNKFISLNDFDAYIANKANSDACINLTAISEIALQLSADEIAKGCQLDDTLGVALNIALDGSVNNVAPYRSVTLSVRNGNRALLQIHERAHFGDDFSVEDYVATLRKKLHNTNAGMKYHIIAVPMGIVNPWDYFGILIPEPVLYHHMDMLKQDFWCQLAQLNNTKVNEVLKANQTLAQIMNTNHWIP